MRVRYSVSFEFETAPPLTHRGEVRASQVDTCMRLATRDARLALRPQGWRSVVCVLLDRLPDADEVRTRQNLPDPSAIREQVATTCNLPERAVGADDPRRAE